MNTQARGHRTFEERLLLCGRGGLELLLDEARAVLVAGELHDMAADLGQGQVLPVDAEVLEQLAAGLGVGLLHCRGRPARLALRRSRAVVLLPV